MPLRDGAEDQRTPALGQAELVAQIKFTEWTADGKLRHPVYLGLRDDKKPSEVVREEQARVSATSIRVNEATGPEAAADAVGSSAITLSDVVDQLRALERSRRNGALELPGGARVSVTNLHKVFWPEHEV